MSKVSESVIDKIKKEHVTPKPKWWFVAMHSVMWLVIAAAVLVGSMAVGVMVGEFVGVDWAHVHRLGRGPVPGAVLALPYLWFGMLALTMLLSYILFKHTKKGYRYHPLVIVGATVLISVLAGLVLYISRMSERFELMMIERVPSYAEYQMGRERMWVAPERGLLAGTVVEKRDDVLIILNDLREREWQVDISEARYKEGMVDVGMQVMVIGEKGGDYDFVASVVKPFKPLVPADFRKVKKSVRKMGAPL